MAFKLSKQDAERRAKEVADLNELKDKVNAAVETYNEKVTELKAAVQEAVDEYNGALAEARGFVEDVASQAQSEYDDKSERWQESEKGMSVAEWISEWESAELEDIELTFPDDLALDDIEHPDVIENLPEEASA